MAHAMKKAASAEEEEEDDDEEEEEADAKSRPCCVDVELMERELDCVIDKQEFIIYSNRFEVRRIDKELVKNRLGWSRMSERRWHPTCRWHRRLPRTRCT